MSVFSTVSVYGVIIQIFFSHSVNFMSITYADVQLGACYVV